MEKQVFSQFLIFQGMTNHEIKSLQSIMELCCFSKDFFIFEQGQNTKYFYILLKGEVIIRHKPYDGPSLTVAHITPGDVFGWSAALGRDTYTSAAIAVEEIEAFRLERHELRLLRENAPETCKIFLEHLANGIAKRLRNTHSEVLSILSNGIDIHAQLQEEK